MYTLSLDTGWFLGLNFILYTKQLTQKITKQTSIAAPACFDAVGADAALRQLQNHTHSSFMH